MGMFPYSPKPLERPHGSDTQRNKETKSAANKKVAHLLLEYVTPFTLLARTTRHYQIDWECGRLGSMELQMLANHYNYVGEMLDILQWSVLEAHRGGPLYPTYIKFI